MDELGWDSCDVILVTGDAYVDHPSFGMALVGRLLEAQGFRVGIIAQPDWRSAEPFRALGQPDLFLGRHRRQHGLDGQPLHGRPQAPQRRRLLARRRGRPAARTARVIVYAQRCREAFDDVPIVIGGIEAQPAPHRALRLLVGQGAPLGPGRRARPTCCVYGNAERAIVEIAHRLAAGEALDDITRRARHRVLRARGGAARRLDRDRFDDDRRARAASRAPVDPYAMPREPTTERRLRAGAAGASRRSSRAPACGRASTARAPVIRLPDFERSSADPVLYAHASRILHLEANPGNARALVQRHGDRDVWLNPPPMPLTTAGDGSRLRAAVHARAAPALRRREDPRVRDDPLLGDDHARLLRRLHLLLDHRARGPHHPEPLRGVDPARDRARSATTSPGFTGVISDLGGPTANMYRLACKSPEIEAACRQPSCVYPGICANLQHRSRAADPALPQGARAAGRQEGPDRLGRALRPGGDVARVRARSWRTHHVGGYLKIAPEHTEDGPLSKMMKPGIGTYDRFKAAVRHATRRRRARSST